jgi:DNA-binding MarR family transcriptional regulator
LRVFQRWRGANGSTLFADRIASMPRRPTELAADDRTPQARLIEAGLHGVVGYQLAQASIVTTQVFDAAVGGASRLRPVEYTMLALIHANPDVTARQLARGLAVTPPNIAVWIERLQSRGLVLRSRSETDARLQHIRVSTTGAKLVRDATKRLQEGEAAALASLSAAERAMLVELLHKVALARKRAAAN